MERMESRDLINAHLEKARAGAPTTVELARKLLGPKEDLTLTLVQRTEEPVRAQSPARAHQFASQEGFGAYLQRHGAASGTIVLADVRTGKMAAVLDETQGQGYEVVTFTPVVHPLFAPWQELFGRAQRLKDLARFIVAHQDLIVTPEPELTVAKFKSIQISKSITLHDGLGAQCEQGVVCSTKIQGKPSDRVETLPERLTIECPLFVGGPVLVVDVDILFEPDDDGVYATLVSSDAEWKRVVAIEGMIELLRGQLPESLVTLGTLHYEDWKYINRQR